MAERETAKAKLLVEIAAAKRKHAEFSAKEAIDKPERDRKRAECETQLREERRVRSNKVQAEWHAIWRASYRQECREYHRKYRAANVEKIRASGRLSEQKRRDKKKAERLAEQINACPNLLEPEMTR